MMSATRVPANVSSCRIPFIGVMTQHPSLSFMSAITERFLTPARPAADPISYFPWAPTLQRSWVVEHVLHALELNISPWALIGCSSNAVLAAPRLFFLLDLGNHQPEMFRLVRLLHRSVTLVS